MADRFTDGFDDFRHKGIRIGTLWCSRNDVDGEVTLSPEFDRLGDVGQLDFLQDVIGLLQKQYDHVHAQMFNEAPDV